EQFAQLHIVAPARQPFDRARLLGGAARGLPQPAFLAGDVESGLSLPAFEKGAGFGQPAVMDRERLVHSGAGGGNRYCGACAQHGGTLDGGAAVEFHVPTLSPRRAAVKYLRPMNEKGRPLGRPFSSLTSLTVRTFSSP